MSYATNRTSGCCRATRRIERQNDLSEPDHEVVPLPRDQVEGVDDVLARRRASQHGRLQTRPTERRGEAGADDRLERLRAAVLLGDEDDTRAVCRDRAVELPGCRIPRRTPPGSRSRTEPQPSAGSRSRSVPSERSTCRHHSAHAPHAFLARDGSARSRERPARALDRVSGRRGCPTGELHGYLAHAPQVVLILATLSLLGLAADARARRRSPVPLSLLAIVAFVVQEHLERLIHTGEMPFLLTSPVLWLGIALQLPLALAVWWVARRLADDLAAPPRCGAPRVAWLLLLTGRRAAQVRSLGTCSAAHPRSRPSRHLLTSFPLPRPSAAPETSGDPHA